MNESAYPQCETLRREVRERPRIKSWLEGGGGKGDLTLSPYAKAEDIISAVARGLDEPLEHVEPPQTPAE